MAKIFRNIHKNRARKNEKKNGEKGAKTGKSDEGLKKCEKMATK